MKEQFVTFEIATRMCDLGFDDDDVFGYYNQAQIGDNKWILDDFFDLDAYNTISAPLWQQAIDWIETKGFYINITRVFQWSPKPITFSGWCIHIGTNNPEENLECNLYFLDHFYPTKKEAREVAILKALTLIK